MSETPDINATEPGPPAAPPAVADPEEPTAGEKLLAVFAIVLGVAVIVMGLDMVTGGRVLGFTIPPQE